MDIGKICMIAFCVLCIAGMIFAEILVSRDEKETLRRRKSSDRNDRDPEHKD
ncbi:MAG: hypothetical protein IKI77_01090 [Oscillospiraceae bacterium]|nr:hypothetical protein [Oscillospiraceae bacterium]